MDVRMGESIVSSPLTEMNKQDLKTLDEYISKFSVEPEKLTSDGRLLKPQPSSDPADPLNWFWFRKHIILFQISMSSMVGLLASSAILPSFGLIAKDFHTSSNIVSYQASACDVGNMIGTLLWAPVSTTYGRRPVYLLSGLMSFTANLGGGFAPTYAGLFASRVFQGLGSAMFNVVAAASIADLFFLHERGAKTGVWTYLTNSGFDLSIIIGGVVTQAAGFRWAIQLTTILKGVLLISTVFLLPETLYHRRLSTVQQIKPSGFLNSNLPVVNKERKRPIYANLTRAPLKRIGSPVKLQAILEPFKIETSEYFATLFVVGFVFANKGISILVSQVYPVLYAFNSRQQGLTFCSFLIGGIIGEALAGWLSDYIILKRTKANNDAFEPEMRLTALPLGIFSASVGLLLWGVFINIDTHWIGPVLAGGAKGMAHYGIQINTTLVMAYILDCYGPTQKTASAVTVIWVFRNLFETTIPFYDLHTSKKLGFTKWFSIQFAILLGCGLASMLLLWPSVGKRLRNWSDSEESEEDRDNGGE